MIHFCVIKPENSGQQSGGPCLCPSPLGRTPFWAELLQELTTRPNLHTLPQTCTYGDTKRSRFLSRFLAVWRPAALPLTCCQSCTTHSTGLERTSSPAGLCTSCSWTRPRALPANTKGHCETTTDPKSPPTWIHLPGFEKPGKRVCGQLDPVIFWETPGGHQRLCTAPLDRLCDSVCPRPADEQK